MPFLAEDYPGIKMLDKSRDKYFNKTRTFSVFDIEVYRKNDSFEKRATIKNITLKTVGLFFPYGQY
jgi:hypothetical protein